MLFIDIDEIAWELTENVKKVGNKKNIVFNIIYRFFYIIYIQLYIIYKYIS